MIGRDGIAGLVVLAASVVLYYLTLGIEGNPLVAIGPEFYPRLLLGITALLSVLVIGADFVAQRRGRVRARDKGMRPNYVLVVATFAVFLCYVVFLPYLGFRIATFLFIGALRVLLDPPRSASSWAGVLVLAILATLATWFVFEQYLAVLLPRGRWTDF